MGDAREQIEREVYDFLEELGVAGGGIVRLSYAISLTDRLLALLATPERGEGPPDDSCMYVPQPDLLAHDAGPNEKRLLAEATVLGLAGVGAPKGLAPDAGDAQDIVRRLTTREPNYTDSNDAAAELRRLRAENEYAHGLAEELKALRVKYGDTWEELLSLRSALPAQPGWRPIESAPKDGQTVVDLWCVTDDNAAASFYFGETKVRDRVQWQGRVTGCYWKDGAWRPKVGLTRLHGLTVEPTAWMSLPTPPGSASESEAEPTPEALEAWAEWADVHMKGQPTPHYLPFDTGYLLREIARRLRAAREE